MRHAGNPSSTINPVPDRLTGESGTAVWIMVSAGAVIAATSLIAKTLGQPVDAAAPLHPFQVSAGRFAFAFIALTFFIALQPTRRPTIRGARWPWHLGRSISGWLGITAMFAAVAQMPIAEATAISFLSPVVAMALAVPFLGERPGPRKLVAAALAVTGALLILRPGSDALQAAGIFALAAAFFMGVETIFIKRLSDSEPPLRILLINNGLGAAVSLCAATLVWQMPSVPQWGLLVALGCIMICGQALFIQAMKRGEASFVVHAFYSILVFAAIYDALLFRVIPDGLAVVGAMLIALGAIVLARSPSR